MAVITPTVTEQGNGYYIAKWVLATRGDTGAPIRCGMDSDISVQVTGSLGTDTVTIQGTNWALTGIPNNDSAKNVAAESTPLYANLHTPDMVTMSFTGDLSSTQQLNQVLERVAYIRPSYNTAGSGGTSAVVRMLLTTSVRW